MRITSNDPCKDHENRGQIPYSTARDTNQCHHSTSRRAIPQCRRAIPHDTGGSFTNKNDCLKCASRLWTLIDAYVNPVMRDKATPSTNMCVHLYSYVYIYIHIYKHVYVYIYIYIYTFVCIYIHTYLPICLFIYFAVATEPRPARGFRSSPPPVAIS